MKYKILTNSRIAKGGYKLTPFRRCDLEFVRKWRNSQIEVLRQERMITQQEQVQYYLDKILPTYTSNQPKQILFSYLYNNKCIGYGGLTNIIWNQRQAELSFLLNTSRANNARQYMPEFRIFLQMIKKIFFEDLKFHLLHAETYDFRKDYIDILEESGFLREKELINLNRNKNHKFSYLHSISKVNYEFK